MNVAYVLDVLQVLNIIDVSIQTLYEYNKYLHNCVMLINTNTGVMNITFPDPTPTRDPRDGLKTL